MSTPRGTDSVSTLSTRLLTINHSGSPVRELVTLLGGPSPKDESKGGAETPSSTMELSAWTASSKLFAATDMMRVSATLLWAVLAVLKHRIGDLVRLDSTLSFFMQTWQDRSMSSSSVVVNLIPVSDHVATCRHAPPGPASRS